MKNEFAFTGVSEELLRATAPVAAGTQPIEKPILPIAKKKMSEEVADHSKVTHVTRVTGEEADPYGLKQGRDSCLRSVLQRIRGGHMNSMEEARALHFLIENKVVKSQSDLAIAMHKPKSKISEKLSILKLPRSVQLLMERNPEVITEGHAVELLRLKEDSLIINVASRIQEQKLSRDRLRTEIAFLLQKHGIHSTTQAKRNPRIDSKVRSFDKVDGGFDLICRFRRDGDPVELQKMISELEERLEYLKKIQTGESTQDPSGDSSHLQPSPLTLSRLSNAY